MADGFITRRGGGVNVNDATATENDVLQGETFYSGDKDIKTGNIPSKGSETFTPSTSNQTIASGQYLSGTQTILGDSDLQAANIKSGVSIFGVTGNLSSNPLPQRVQYWSGTEYVTWTASPNYSSGGINVSHEKLSDRLRVNIVRPSGGGSVGVNGGFTATINLDNIDFIIADVSHYGCCARNSNSIRIAIANSTDLRSATLDALIVGGYSNTFSNPTIHTLALDVTGFSGNQIVAMFARGASFNSFDHNYDFFNLRLARFD